MSVWCEWWCDTPLAPLKSGMCGRGSWLCWLQLWRTLWTQSITFSILLFNFPLSIITPHTLSHPSPLEGSQRGCHTRTHSTHYPFSPYIYRIITMDKTSKIYIAGHRGMVGSAIYRTLAKEGYNNICAATSQELNLKNTDGVNRFFEEEKPEYVFIAAAKVGGIMANDTYPADFLYDNLMIQNNLIEASFRHSVKKLLFLGSACIYPKFAPQPIREDSLLSGYLEPTNEAYAIAKIAGIKLCQAYSRQHGCNFISAMPTNLYGYGDNFHPRNSHVLPGLLRRFHEAVENGAEEVIIWGSGTPLREFMFADDVGAACLHLMLHYDKPDVINVGTGEEVSILDLANLVAETVGFRGRIGFDKTKPDGTPRKVLDSNRLHKLGFTPGTALREGLKLTYEDFLRKVGTPEIRLA